MMPSLSAFASARTVQHSKSNFGSPQEHQETGSKRIQIKTLSRTLLRGNHVPISTGAPGDWQQQKRPAKIGNHVGAGLNTEPGTVVYSRRFAHRQS